MSIFSIEHAFEFIDPVTLRYRINKIYNNRRSLFRQIFKQVFQYLFLILPCGNGHAQGSMKIMNFMSILYGWRGVHDMIYSTLLAMVSKLGIKSHKRSKFVVHWSSESTLASSCYAEFSRLYSVWVEKMPV